GGKAEDPASCWSDLRMQGRAGIQMPDRGGSEPMPVRALAAGQQKIDRRRSCAAIAGLLFIAKGLAKMSALGMRFQRQHPDDVLCGQSGHDSATFFSLFAYHA